MSAPPSPQKEHHVLVIGAGIIGLQCALTLLSTSPSSHAKYRVSIVAEYIPGDDAEAAAWDVETYRFWERLVHEPKGRGSGVAIVKGLNYWAELKSSHDSAGGPTTQTTENPDPWWSTYVRNYRRIEQANLPPDTAFGVSFDTFTVDVQVYLAYLRKEIEALGGTLVRAKLPTDSGFAGAVQEAISVIGMPPEDSFDMVINASGMQAKELVGDDRVYPVRGQTIAVKGETKNCITRLGADANDRTVIIPRIGSGTTIIGVTSEPGNYSLAVDESRVPTLLNAAKPFCPELLNKNGDFEVVRAGVGIRPSRKGGARVELELIEKLPVVHAYGVSGAGYQNSIGLARKVLRLVEEHFLSHMRG